MRLSRKALLDKRRRRRRLTLMETVRLDREISQTTAPTV